jgi:hypothetical protein
VCVGSAWSFFTVSGSRALSAAGTLSPAGAKFWIVRVKVAALTAVEGAGIVAVPLKPCELGSVTVVGPLPGPALNDVEDVVAVKNGEVPVSAGGGVVPPP